MPLYSDVAVQRAIPDSGNLKTDEIAQMVEDSRAVYEYVHRQPGATQAKLRNWGEGKDIEPDRMNQALGLLKALGKVHELPELGPGDPEPEPKPRRAAK